MDREGNTGLEEAPGLDPPPQESPAAQRTSTEQHLDKRKTLTKPVRSTELGSVEPGVR